MLPLQISFFPGCARGGYGAVRLIEGLLAETKKRGKPPFKVLVGFSDLTILLDFVW